MLFTGIPHGALDHLVAKQNSVLQNRSFSSIHFYTAYLSRMAAYGICWYFFPSFSLVFFILISAFHFGETDIVIIDTHRHLSILFLQATYGLLIVLILILTHTKEVLPILAITGHNNSSVITGIFEPKNRLLFLSIAFVLMLFSLCWLHIKRSLTFTGYRNFIVQTALLILPVILLPLPLAFTFYFGCWHSLHSLENIRQHLSKAEGNEISFISILKKCIPYSLVAFAGIAVLIVLVNYSGSQYLLLFIFFIGIAILTAPHLEVMSHMYAQIRKKIPE